MNSHRTEDRSISITARTPTPFEEEQRQLMQRRLKLVSALGFLVAGVALFFYLIVVGKRSPTHMSPFAPWRVAVFYLHVFSFGAAALLVLVRSWNMRVLLTIDLTLFAFNILLSHFNAAIFDRYYVPVFPISVLLFLHASLVPVRVSAQAGLGVVGAFGFAFTGALVYTLVPEIREFLLATGRRAELGGALLDGTFQLSILAIVSVIMTKALYHMRFSLHRARRLGNYVIEREIGKGGMGHVYLAQHALMCRPTAVKVLEAATGDGDASLARFEREVRLSASLAHPNTITVFDFGCMGRDTFYYAMEYLEGLNLEEFVDHFGPVPPERTVYILTQVCGSLAEAQEKGIVHRDIKPSNIFLSHCGGVYDLVKVLDFGLAKQFKLDGPTSVTRTGILLGTPLYIAPEAVRAPDEIDGRADLYCLGAVAYWMLVGRPPFEAATSLEVIVEHMKASPRRPVEVSEFSIPAELDQIVMRCLEKNPEDRFQTAREVEAALRAIGFDEPWTGERAREWWFLHDPEQASMQN